MCPKKKSQGEYQFQKFNCRDADGGLFDIIFSDPELSSLKESMKEPAFPEEVETTETTKPRFVHS